MIKPESFAQGMNEFEAEGVLDLNALSVDLVQKLELLAPFGEGNPEPLFILKDVRITYANLLKNGHISLGLTNKTNKRMNAIAFRAADTQMGKAFLTTHGDDAFDLLVTIKKDVWKGQTKVQIQILDAKHG